MEMGNTDDDGRSSILSLKEIEKGIKERLQDQKLSLNNIKEIDPQLALHLMNDPNFEIDDKG